MGFYASRCTQARRPWQQGVGVSEGDSELCLEAEVEETRREFCLSASREKDCALHASVISRWRCLGDCPTCPFRPQRLLHPHLCLSPSAPAGDQPCVVHTAVPGPPVCRLPPPARFLLAPRTHFAIFLGNCFHHFPLLVLSGKTGASDTQYT